MELLEVDLDLLDSKTHDEELSGLVQGIESEVKKAKVELEKKQKDQKKKEVEVK